MKSRLESFEFFFFLGAFWVVIGGAVVGILPPFVPQQLVAVLPKVPHIHEPLWRKWYPCKKW